MYKAKVNGHFEFSLELDQNAKEGTLNGEKINIDIAHGLNKQASIIFNYNSYNVELLDIDRGTKTANIKVNGNNYKVELRDKMDQLLESLGMDITASNVVKELKAPMPGLVLEIKVEPGQEVKEGEALLVLEAMKMENVLKAPADVIIDQIKVKASNTIEKNTTLITFK